MVVVATPSHTHAPLAISALEAGKHAVVEKPMAQSVAEVDAMLAAAERTGRILTCYQPRRLDADFVAIQELVAAGRLGRLVLVRRGTYRFTRRADWQMVRKFGGGELANTGAHLLDQVLVLLGGADAGEGGYDEFFADLQHTVGVGDAEDHAKVCFRTRDGATADIEVTLCAALPQPDWMILGTAGALEGRGGELQVKWLDPAALGPLALDEGPAAGRRYGTGEQITWQEETLRPQQERPPAMLFYDRLARTLRENAPLFVTPRSIRPQIEIIERAHTMAAREQKLPS
jgi:predicted dehydrogenase